MSDDLSISAKIPSLTERKDLKTLGGLFFLVLVVGVLSVVSISFYAADKIDKTAIDSSIRLTQSVLSDQQSSLGQTTIDYAWWDDAVENMVISPNEDWADANLGSYFYNSIGLSRTLVVGQNDALIYVYDIGERRDPNDFQENVDVLGHLISEARKTSGEPIKATGFLRLDNDLYLGAASIITPYEKSFPDFVPLEKKHVLVLLKSIDKEFLESIALKYSLPNLRTLEVDTDAGLPSFSLQGSNGEVVQKLTWDAILPGEDVLWNIMPGIGAVLVFLLFVGILFFRSVFATSVYLQNQNTILSETSAQLKTVNSELENLSYMDGLTGVSNRRRFDETIETEWMRGARDGSPLSIVFIDIDYFKLFNDTYGHDEGDKCLRQVAGELSKAVGRSSDLLARYGGEEFVAILPNTDLESAVGVANAFSRAIEKLKIEHISSEISDHLTISIGLACTTPTKDSYSNELLKSADENLYEAKRSGRNKIVF